MSLCHLSSFSLLSLVVFNFSLKAVHRCDLLVDELFKRSHHWHVFIVFEFFSVSLMVLNLFLKLYNSVSVFRSQNFCIVNHVCNYRFKVIEADQIIRLLAPFME